MYKKFYQEFLKGHAPFTHFASHSHHFWPDISLEGQIEAWKMASLKSDQKWGKILTETLPAVQKLIAKNLNFSRPSDIAFASNTHELLTRLISSLDFQSKIKVLSTKSEFHSFSRQLKRYQELPQFEVTLLDNEAPSFTEDLIQKLEQEKFDLIFLSHVFFNSGKILELEKIKKSLKQIDPKKSLMVIDGYHAFCAIPVDIKELENHIFYIAGGYKYAQAGEGVCFMTLPQDCQLRPLNTGWFAHFDSLEEEQTQKVLYSSDGMRFWGSTMDPSAFFRFKKVWEFFTNEGLSVEKIHLYIQSLQKQLITAHPDLFLETDLTKLGHFLTIEFPDSEVCRKSYQVLETAKILCDFRGNRLRIGFGLYQSQEDLEQLSQAISEAKLINFLKK